MTVSFLDILWLFFIVATVLPMIHQKVVEQRRVHMMRRIQESRGSQIITMIHRQESFSILGLLNRRYINIEDSEQILRVIRRTPDDVPIDLVLHTPGGLVLASEQIAYALQKHPAKVTVFVPHYAMSGGTLIAMAANEIWMDENAVLGPVDPQLGNYPAASILKVVEQKERNEIDDETLILADIAAKAVRQVEDVVVGILERKMDRDKATEIAGVLTQGHWTHDYPLTCDQVEGLGLAVHCGLPEEIYALMDLYPQPQQRRPSVQYIPVPYRGGEEPARAATRFPRRGKRILPRIKRK